MTQQQPTNAMKILEKVNAAITRIQTGAEKPRASVVNKSGPGHFTVRVENVGSTANLKAMQACDAVPK